MNQLPFSQIIAAACFSAAIALGWLCLRLTRQAREAVQHLLALATEHEGQLKTVRNNLSVVSQRAAEQARRLALLEARRQAGAMIPEPALAATLPNPASTFVPPSTKLSMTERRHRVLALARRGLDVGTIATSLAMPHGEVELIIELNKAATESAMAFS